MGLDASWFILEVEKQFNVTIDDSRSEFPTYNLGTFHKLLIQILKEQNKNMGMNDDEVWNKMVKILGETMSIDVSNVHENTRFVEDLGMD
jgi:acyl carrier protein